MKTLKIFSLLAIVAILSSCSNDDDNNNQEIVLSESEIPTEIIAYKTTHFPENEIVNAIKDTEGNIVTYDIYLSGNFELDFNSNYEITDIDGISKLPDSVIPPVILDYVAQNYASNVITDWELEHNHQQIELNNGVELEFEMNGTFIRIDND